MNPLLFDNLGNPTDKGKTLLSKITATLTLRGYKYTPTTALLRNKEYRSHMWRTENVTIQIHLQSSQLTVRYRNRTGIGGWRWSLAKNIVPISFSWDAIARGLSGKVVTGAERRP